VSSTDDGNGNGNGRRFALSKETRTTMGTAAAAVTLLLGASLWVKSEIASLRELVVVSNTEAIPSRSPSTG
jgi:hypothetical protein